MLQVYTLYWCVQGSSQTINYMEETCVNFQQNRTLWNQINMSFISISILDLYQHGMQDHHETKSRWTYFYSWIVSTWDARSPWDQNKMSIIFGLDLYQHGDARSPWDQIKMDIFLFLNCINMGCKIAMRPKQDEHNFWSWLVSTWRCKITMRPKQEEF